MKLQLLRSRPIARKSANKITDRAKRYRARKNVQHGKHCFACGNPKPRGVHHLDGFEANDSPKNLVRVCQSCNGKMAHVYKKAGIGKKTQQYNPSKKSRARGAAAKSLGQYLSAVQITKGDAPGNLSAAIKTLQETSADKRSEYARRIWDIRKERYPPTGVYKSSQKKLEYD